VGGRKAAGFAGAACAALVLASTAAAAPRASQWTTWWGSAAFAPTGITLSSTPPAAPSETHSALVTTRQTWLNPTISFTTTTLAQLRTGSAPNPWEVGWVMFRFRDLSDYYYFILKPNGYELGKKQGSDAQIFLATGSLPALVVGAPRRVQVIAKGPRIRVLVDGSQVVDYTDPHPLAAAGSVGLYEEDSRVVFSSFTAS
jgi:hypothetical protein